MRSKGLLEDQQVANWLSWLSLDDQGISNQQREDAPVTEVF